MLDYAGIGQKSRTHRAVIISLPILQIRCEIFFKKYFILKNHEYRSTHDRHDNLQYHCCSTNKPYTEVVMLSLKSATSIN